MMILPKWVYALIAVACAAIAANASADNREAIRLLRQKNFEQAQKEFAAAAETGNPESQYLLGIGLLQGKYFEKNEQEGLRLLRASSGAGFGHASFALFQYLSNDGKHSLSETIPLLEKAAAQGSSRAKFLLDVLLRRSGGMTSVYSDLDAFIPIEVNPMTTADIPAARQNGKAVFENTCAACHERGIAGAPMRSEAARWAELRKGGFENLVGHAIRGFKGHPPRGGLFSLSGDDIRDAVFYMSTPGQP